MSSEQSRLNSLDTFPLREKCPYSDFFESVFSHIRKKHGELWSISPYLVQMRENTDQKNSEYGHFSRSVLTLGGEDITANENIIKKPSNN